MAVRFIIGRAGTGKTHHCLEAVRTRLRADPVDGPCLILLVPEQAGLQMERAILGGAGVGGAHRAEVVSFRRLAQRVLEWSGTPVRRALSEPARVMVLRQLLLKHASSLRYYRKVAQRSRGVGRLGGFVERLTATVAELIQEAVEPDDLAALLDAAGAHDPAQRAKLHDLHLIYSAYLDYLGPSRLDPSRSLQIARERLGQCTWIHGAELWVDGFASMARQETLTLVALAKWCQHVDITAMVDPSLCRPRATLDDEASRLFARTAATQRDLERALIEGGLELEAPLLLSPDPPPRFSSCASLARIERTLFQPRGSEPPPAIDPTTSRPAPVGVELVALPSRRIEVAYAVSRVCQWVQDPATPYRYRDVAIIVRDLEPYHDLLTQALDARGIPFFIDRRRPIAHHPLIELLRAGVAMSAEDLSLPSVKLALATGLLGLSNEAADELENYLLAHGLRGADDWQREDWTHHRGGGPAEPAKPPNTRVVRELARVNESRKAFLECVTSWLEQAGQGETLTGSAWAEAMIRWLNRLGVAKTLHRWADLAERDGELDQAEQHRQVWRDTMSFLDDLAFAFAEVGLSTDERADVLEAGLSGLTLGLAPPMIDQVLVGSIDRSRHPDIKAAVVLGFNDGVFPKQLTEDSILNDDDRAALQSAGVRIGPPARERVLDESLLLYTAMTRPSEALVVSYALTDSDGKALRVSPYASALTAALPGLVATRVGDPSRLRETWDVLSFGDLTERLALEFRTRPVLSEDDLHHRCRWNELYDSVRTDLDESAASRRALASLGGRGVARVSPALVEAACGASPLRTSVSQLETYATCPFQYFAKYLLKLRERVEATLEPVDVGKVHHAVLEDFVNAHLAGRMGFAQLSEDDLIDALRGSCSRIAAQLPEGAALSDARSAYLLRRSTADLARVLRAQRNVSQAGTYRPRAAEVPFGFDTAGALPAMELSTPAGRHVRLRGYIDRVDLAELSDELLGVVIDYKRTRDKKLNLSEVYHGLSLQLLAYLLVLAECGESLAGRPIRPGGALYISLVPRYEVVDHPDLSGERERALSGSFRPRGVLSTAAFDAFDTSGSAGWSSLFSMYRKADGTFGHIDSSDAAGHGSLTAMLEHTKAKLGEFADGILDGDVAVRPYRLGTFSPCSWCPMTSVCGFEMGLSEVRFLETLTRSEVFKRFEGKRS